MSVPCCLRRQQGGYSRRKCLTWQEQYDLGIKFLSDGNYEEAIIAFIAAIEIDPKQVDAYIRLAEIYTAQGDTEKAVEILNQALDAVGENETISVALEQLAFSGENYQTHDDILPASRPQRRDFADGSYFIYDYDFNGNILREMYYLADNSLYSTKDNSYDTSGNLVSAIETYFAGDSDCQSTSFKYDLSGRTIETVDYWIDGGTRTKTYFYSGTAVTIFIQFIDSTSVTQSGSIPYTMASPNHQVLCLRDTWGINDELVNAAIYETDPQSCRVAAGTYDTNGNLIEAIDFGNG